MNAPRGPNEPLDEFCVRMIHDQREFHRHMTEVTSGVAMSMFCTVIALWKIRTIPVFGPLTLGLLFFVGGGNLIFAWKHWQTVKDLDRLDGRWLAAGSDNEDEASRIH